MRILFLPFLVAIIASAIPLSTLAAPQDGQTVLVVAPFSREGAIGVMANAEGRLVAATRFHSIALVSSDAPGFASRLYRAGAVLVLNADALSGCPPEKEIR
jgi:hypothetical protein